MRRDVRAVCGRICVPCASRFACRVRRGVRNDGRTVCAAACRGKAGRRAHSAIG